MVAGVYRFQAHEDPRFKGQQVSCDEAKMMTNQNQTKLFNGLTIDKKN